MTPIDWSRRVVPMKKSRYTPQQIAFGLRQAEEGSRVMA